MKTLSAVFLLGMFFVLPSRAGDSLSDPLTMESFLKAFLCKQPRFQATGIFTSKKIDHPAVTCAASVRFDKRVGAVFSYNTDATDLEPYDFYYWKRSLALLVYDRDRSKIVKSEFLGSPERPVFNFVWDVIQEGEKGRSLKSLIFSGLMRTTLEENENSIQVTFQKSLVPLPIRKLSFTMDPEYRLQAIKLTESDGSTHSFRVLKFQKLTEKLRKPKVQMKP